MNKFEWGNNRRFNSFANYSTSKYGSRLQKLSINSGFTCPNRDGKIGIGGCTFCVNEAFNPSYCTPEKNITQQIDEGITFHKIRYRRASKYIAYFQAYSNTYADIEKLKSVYSEALDHPDIFGISIGTRPDCINDDLLSYLSEINKKHYIAIEYGVESCYNKTLELVNRQHSFEASKEAIIKTNNIKIFNTAHLIIGLPNETKEMILKEATLLSNLPINAIKLHQLQIFKGTEIEKLYASNPDKFIKFELNEYVDFIIDFMELLRPSIIIERLTGEVPPRFLAFTPWCKLRTDQILNLIEKRMEDRNTWQGKKYPSIYCGEHSR